MEQKPDFNVAIVRNIQNDDLYHYLGNNLFKNIRTQKEGIVDDEMARKIFRINMEATVLISKNPNIEKLINKLGLKFCNQ